ncbi:MAG TPA: 5-(carboxyamino)imidazole ribonucleotide synthase, partial [Alphaproteobacteria bacterium]|nr:5-(carboxyamino)imidazole ribonucleotide synthase [Alphaproteobacteria bacterium]
QLGRMTVLAAARLGYRCHIFTPEADSPASQVAAATTVAAWDDRKALDAFAAAVDVVTLEWENIPVPTVEAVAVTVPVHPGAGVLAVTQSRLEEKDFVNAAGAATARFQAAYEPNSLARVVERIGRPCILKSNRMGYDGKGQVRIDADTDLGAAWARMGGDTGIVESIVPFEREVSVIVARRADGAMATYPVVENRHRDAILHETHAPAAVAPEVARRADEIARKIAESLRLVGLLAVEMFVTADGQVLVNELAPRPHNSGHWTLDFCATSQFEQLVRAVCGLPLGATDVVQPCVMTNLIGDEAGEWQALMRQPGARVHLYGKAEARPGRKMGHVTRPA